VEMEDELLDGSRHQAHINTPSQLIRYIALGLTADPCSRRHDANLYGFIDNSHRQVKCLPPKVIWFDLNDRANSFTAN
jgi:hypothetical protein